MITHIVGGALGIAALVVCVVRAALHHNGFGVVASGIYGVCMMRCHHVQCLPRLRPAEVAVCHGHLFLIGAPTRPSRCRHPAAESGSRLGLFGLNGR